MENIISTILQKINVDYNMLLYLYFNLIFSLYTRVLMLF